MTGTRMQPNLLEQRAFLDMAGPDSPRSSTRKSYTLEKKLSVVKAVEEKNLSLSAAERKFGINRRRIREWIQKKNELKVGPPVPTGIQYSKVQALYPPHPTLLLSKGNLICSWSPAVGG